MENLLKKIEKIKKEKDIAVLAHYYVNDEVQDAADYIGDSFYLSKMARTLPQKTICLCGVSFMGESAAIMNDDKKVLIPNEDAGCAMADMAQADKVRAVKEQYEDVAVVCYINSTAELKSCSDVCVTSSNAMDIVKSLKQKNIYFIPDENLAHYISQFVPEKNFIFNDGYCYVHKNIKEFEIIEAKQKHPDALLLMHPECTKEALKHADYIGSTSGIIDFAAQSANKEFIIGTEIGVMYKLKMQNPDKLFFTVNDNQICKSMKMITLESLYNCLKNEIPVIKVNEKLRLEALKPLERMMEF